MFRGRIMLVVWFILSALLAGFRLAASLPSSSDMAQPKPHIILIVADDLGWNDVSWHNPQVLTPHLEELARGGVLLNQSYVQPICTPTRSALLTGRYPYALGRQHSVLWPEEPTGLSIKRKLLPQALKEAGYSTHAVGKWHLGFCSWDYTPTSRGFDTFWGYYTGAEDYYHHTRGTWHQEELDDLLDQNDLQEKPMKDSAIKFGYDFRNNTVPDYSVDGVYSTYLFTSYIENLLESRSPEDPMFLYLPFQSVHSPLQVPENYTKPFEHIKHYERKIKLGMVLAMDEAVGRVVEALKNSGHYNNSVIVFTTDNGGPTVSAGNNWPLRGNKSTLWEGGTRGAAFVHSPLLPQKGIVSDKLIHVTDWFSTLAGLGGGVTPADTDGYDQWEALTTSAPSPRKEMIYNIDVTHEMNAGIRMGDFKLLVGDPGPGKWTPPPEGIQNNFNVNFSVDYVTEESQLNVSESTSPPEPNTSVAFNEEPRLSKRKPLLQSKYRGSGPFVFTVGNVIGKDAPRQRNGKSLKQPAEKVYATNLNTITVKRTDKKQDEPTRNFTEMEEFSSADNEMNIEDQHYEDQSDFQTVGDLRLDLNQFKYLRQLLRNDTPLRLYNITDDPEERIDLSSNQKGVVKILLGFLQHHMKDYVKPDILPNKPSGNPRHWNNTWTPGWCTAK